MKEKMEHFGEHITIDGYGGDPEKLNDEDVVRGCLSELPGKIGMKTFGDPLIYKVPPNDKKDPGGWTGMVLIVESHISLHTFPARGFISADVYSCKSGMDLEFILKYFREKFSLKDIEHNFIRRGTKYPEKNIHN